MVYPKGDLGFSRGFLASRIPGVKRCFLPQADEIQQEYRLLVLEDLSNGNPYLCIVKKLPFWNCVSAANSK